MALPTLQRKLFKNDGYGPEIKDERLSADITVKDWDASHDYPANVLAKAGGNIYRSAAVSGPGTSAGAKNPVSDDGTYWTPVPTNNSDVVHISGNETITGYKEFYHGLSILNDVVNFSTYLHMYTSNFQRGGAAPSITQYCDFLFMDNNGKAIGGFVSNVQTSGSVAQQIRVWDYSDASNDIPVTVQLLASKAFSYFVFGPLSPDNNKIYLGQGGARWKEVFAVSGTINTSDERLKTSIEAFPDAVLDAWGDVDFVQYQFRDAVNQKGKTARLHTGLVAQRIDEIFKAHGLDASRYGLFCHDSWNAEPEQRDEKGALVSPAREAGDEYSLRYGEALCMEAAYQRRRADRAEARIASLEARLAALEAKLNG